MSAWMKMAVTVLVMVMPGGLLFLLFWALGRALRTRLREAAVSRRMGPLQALSTIRLRDLWREARQMSGLSPVPN